MENNKSMPPIKIDISLPLAEQLAPIFRELLIVTQMLGVCVSRQPGVDKELLKKDLRRIAASIEDRNSLAVIGLEQMVEFIDVPRKDSPE